MNYDNQEKKSFLDKLPANFKFYLYNVNPLNQRKYKLIDDTVEKFAKTHDKDYYMGVLLSRCSEKEKTILKDYYELNVKERKEKMPIFIKWLGNKLSALASHDALKEYTPKVGIKYETNFSNLID